VPMVLQQKWERRFKSLVENKRNYKRVFEFTFLVQRSKYLFTIGFLRSKYQLSCTNLVIPQTILSDRLQKLGTALNEPCKTFE
jgi:hypothetical protein